VRVSRVELWFGVLGAPLAWVLQFLVGFGFTLAQCNRAGSVWSLPVDAWTIGAPAAGAAVALLAGLASLHIFRATRDAGEAPPAGRVHFLSVVGLTITPLFLAIILMSGLGAASLPDCHQG
jgi:hypothetical protein